MKDDEKHNDVSDCLLLAAYDQQTALARDITGRWGISKSNEAIGMLLNKLSETEGLYKCQLIQFTITGILAGLYSLVEENNNAETTTEN